MVRPPAQAAKGTGREPEPRGPICRLVAGEHQGAPAAAAAGPPPLGAAQSLGGRSRTLAQAGHLPARLGT
jgi:hypothetical protein